MSSKPFDATLKDLIETDAAAWVALAGQSCTSARLIDADVSTVSAAADKVLLLERATGNSLLNLEPEARFAADVAGRMHLYATLLHHRHGLLVRSVAVLLRREAEARSLTGVYELRHPDECEPYLTFRYGVLRVWQLPVDELLRGGLGTLPLALLADDAEPRLETVVKEAAGRLQAEAEPAVAARLRTAMYILTGLRYSAEVANHLFKGITSMKESSTYQAILAEGREQGLSQGGQSLLLHLGTKKFGPPDEGTRAAISRITALEQLEELADRIGAVATWQELLGS